MVPAQSHDGETEGAPYRDRSLGLVIFGALVVLMGAFCALLAPLSLVSWWISREDPSTGASLAATLPMMVVYVGIAAALVTLGIGSIRARRWACDLMRSVSRIWLVTGVCSLVLTWAVLPKLISSLGVAEDFPPGLVLVTTAVAFGVLSVVYVLLPTVLLLFYRSQDVAATCRARDPVQQFTDRCPQRVLTLAIVWGVAGVSVLTMPAYNWAFPFFGRLLTGARGAVPWLVVMVLCLALAWGSFRRVEWAWWGGVAITLCALLATLLTSILLDPSEFLTALHLPEDQLAALSSVPWPSTWVICVGWTVAWSSMLAYLATLRRHFEPPKRTIDG